MLKNTFIHIPGVGHKTEKEFWEAGLTDWERHLAAFPDSKISAHLQESVEALALKNLEYFAQALPHNEHWRLFEHFRDSCAFVDIETTGFSKYYDDITLMGLYDGKEYKKYVMGENLEEFAKDIQKFKVLVTFNGLLFDAPFIKAKLPEIKMPQVHLDLRFLLSRLGYRGGLKSVEKQLGISRPDEVGEINGYQAVVLWYQYMGGNLESLETLIKYNYEDTVNMHQLMETAYSMLCSNVGHLKKAAKIQPSKVETTGKGRVFIGGIPYLLEGYKNKEEKVHLKDILSPLVKKKKVVGIDLTGSEKRATGWALMEGENAITKTLKTDKELIEETIKAKPDIISIDSPLSFPRGRKSPYDTSPCRKNGISRECERQLKRAGISVFWCLLPTMQNLTIRGMKLAKEFRKRGFEVIESFPGAAQDILGIPRKKTSLQELINGLSEFGIHGDYEIQKVTHDEIDAITSALVGYFYLSGNYEALGNKEEDYLIIPSLAKLDGSKTLLEFLGEIKKQ